jgi:hypothetical protein
MGDAAGASPHQLFLINEVTTTILLPASFVALCAEGLFLAVADRLDPAGAHSSSGQRALDCACALVAERQVVLGGSALVAMSFNRKTHILVLAEELSICLDGRLLVTTNIGLIVVEVDVLDILAEQILIRNIRGGLRWRRRRRYRKSGGRFLRATCAFCDQVIRHRISRRNAL